MFDIPLWMGGYLLWIALASQVGGGRQPEENVPARIRPTVSRGF